MSRVREAEQRLADMGFPVRHAGPGPGGGRYLPGDGGNSGGSGKSGGGDTGRPASGPGSGKENKSGRRTSYEKAKDEIDAVPGAFRPEKVKSTPKVEGGLRRREEGRRTRAHHAAYRQGCGRAKGLEAVLSRTDHRRRALRRPRSWLGRPGWQRLSGQRGHHAARLHLRLEIQLRQSRDQGLETQEARERSFRAHQERPHREAQLL